MKKVFLFVLAFLSFIQWSDAQNVVAYYPFSGNANDQSGNNRNPTFNGASLTTDRFGNANSAYSFTGATNGHIEYSSTGLPETNRTISLWFQSADLSSKPTLLSYGGNGCATALLMTINSSATGHYPSPQYLVTGHCNTNNITYAYPAEPVNAWYHWVLTINGSEQKIFINGELKSTQNTYSGSTYTTNRELAFGVATYIDGLAPYTDGNLGYFNGKLDDIRIYDAALSSSQVQQLYQAESSGLVAFYPFSGNANDSSIFQNHGTVQNAVLTTDRFGNSDKAYSFSATNHITVPYNPYVFTDAFTLSYWFKIPSYYGDRGVLSCVATPNGGFQQWFTGQTFQYILGYNFPVWFWANHILQEPVNQWHQMVLTYQKTGTNNSETKLYINGNLKRTDQHELAISYTPGATFYIGQNHGGLNFQGDLDDLKVYNHVLTAGEILENYEHEATCSGPLTAAITSANNTGAGSLRAAVGCLENGGIITWSPTLDRVLLTTSLAIDKNITISGSDLQVNPVIIFDMMNMTSGFMFSDGVELNIDDVDIKVRNHSANKAITQGDGTLTVSGMTTVFRDLFPLGTQHCNPVFPTEVVDVTNPVTGRTWMDRNLGASRVAISSTDMQSYGDLYQWGRFSDGHQCRTSGITDVLSNSDNPGHGSYIINNISPYDWRSPQNNSLWQIPVNTNNPCPIGYRVPSVEEFNEEVATWTGSGANAAYNSVLKLPLAGGRNTANGNLHDTNNVGYYWTKDPETNESQLLFFYQNTMQISPFNRGFGASVRCIKE